jgi:hypothetical protein
MESCADNGWSGTHLQLMDLDALPWWKNNLVTPRPAQLVARHPIGPLGLIALLLATVVLDQERASQRLWLLMGACLALR